MYIYIYYFAQIYYQYLGSQDESNFDKHFDELGSPGILENSTYWCPELDLEALGWLAIVGPDMWNWLQIPKS